MIEKILNFLPYIAGALAGVLVYFKGYSDRKKDEKANKADVLDKYSKIDSEQVNEKDVYNHSKW